MRQQRLGRRARRLGGIGLVTAATVIAAVALPMTASATTTTEPGGGFAAADQATITPGVELEIDLGGPGPASCTANYLYRTDGSPHGGGHTPGPQHSKPQHPEPQHPAPEHPEPQYPEHSEPQHPAPEHPGQQEPKPDEHPGGGNDGGEVFIGTAAHCVSEGGSMNQLDGCDPANAPLPLDTPVTVVGTDGERSTATLAYSSWLTMQEAGETDQDRCQFNDFALLRLAPDDVAKANPSVPVFGGPTGLDTDGTQAGERVFSYQPNQVTGSLTPAKQGLSLGQPDGELSHRVTTIPPGIEGDSGSGYLTADGSAFGVLSSAFLNTDGTLNGVNGVTDLANAVDYAGTTGGLGGLALVEGTEPFSTDVTMSPLPTMPAQPSAPMEAVRP